jgi:hypothetical protein
MRRRPRHVREIPFSFDSFLDVVANVCGIIIRLILVVWVGARSYSSLHQFMNQPAARKAETPGEVRPEDDPLHQEIARHRQELAQAQARLLEQLRHFQEVQDDQGQVASRLADLTQQQQALEQVQAALRRTATEASKAHQTAALSLDELRQRQQKLMDQIKALEQAPPAGKVLRYQTPVSRPVHTDEFMFECRNGRVTYIDLVALQLEVRRDIEAKGKMLRTRWQVSDVTEPVGAFRLRYTLERERGLVDAVLPDSGPDANGNYRYGVSEYVVEPVAPVRGEAGAAALAKGSEFRQVVDRLDPQLAVVTFWVYPDSFGLFRQLRDFLYERDLVVAGRPLPPDYPITCSRHGSLSRGQ